MNLRASTSKIAPCSPFRRHPSKKTNGVTSANAMFIDPFHADDPKFGYPDRNTWETTIPPSLQFASDALFKTQTPFALNGEVPGEGRFSKLLKFDRSAFAIKSLVWTTISAIAGRG